MNCEQVKTHLVDYLYGELPAELARELEVALDECPDCAAQLDQMRTVHQRFEALPRLDVPASVHQNILRQARLAVDGQASTARDAKSLWASLFSPPALATALLLTLVVGVGVMLQQQTRSTYDESAGGLAATQSAPAVVAANDDGETGPREPESAVRREGERAAEVNEVSPPGELGGALARAESPPDEPAPAPQMTNAAQPMGTTALEPAEPRAGDVVARLEEPVRGSSRVTPTTTPPRQSRPRTAEPEVENLDAERVGWRGATSSDEEQQELAGRAADTRVDDISEGRAESGRTRREAERERSADEQTRDRPAAERRYQRNAEDDTSSLGDQLAAAAPPMDEEREYAPQAQPNLDFESPAMPIQGEGAEAHALEEESEASGPEVAQSDSAGDDGLLRLVETSSPEPTQWTGEQTLRFAGNDPGAGGDTDGAAAAPIVVATPPTPTTPLETSGAGALGPEPTPDAVAWIERPPQHTTEDNGLPWGGMATDPSDEGGSAATGEGEVETEDLAALDLDELFDRGVQRYNDGSYRDAVQYFSLLLDNAPRTSDFYALSNFYQGQALVSMGNWGQAAGNFEAITDPTFEHYEEARLLLAQSYENSGNLERAEALYSELLTSANLETNARADEGLERIDRRRRGNDANARPDRSNRESTDSLDLAAPPAGAAEEAIDEASEKLQPVAYKP